MADCHTKLAKWIQRATNPIPLRVQQNPDPVHHLVPDSVTRFIYEAGSTDTTVRQGQMD